MNALQRHDPATDNLTVYDHTVVKPGDISIGDLPITHTDDLRGHEPPPETDKEADNTKMIIGAAVVAVVIGGFGAFSYATGMWDTKPAAPLVLATNSAPPTLPAVAPAVVPPAVSVAPPPDVVPAAAPRRAVPAAKVVRTRAPIAKRQAAPAVNTTPTAAVIPLMAAPVEPPTNAIVTPVEPAQSTPTPQPVEPPTQALPDQPAPPPPAQSPASTQPPQ